MMLMIFFSERKPEQRNTKQLVSPKTLQESLIIHKNDQIFMPFPIDFQHPQQKEPLISLPKKRLEPLCFFFNCVS